MSHNDVLGIISQYTFLSLQLHYAVIHAIYFCISTLKFAFRNPLKYLSELANF